MNNTLDFCPVCEIRNLIDIDRYTKRCLSCGVEYSFGITVTTEDINGNITNYKRTLFKDKK